ncbi:MAG: Hpt domain-containing protein, partial [Gallionellaceae bacterium]|nr:Hpt domain-containing protein [Gallionellaceae bacterium]
MISTEQTSPLPLPAVKPELDALLGQASRDLKAYFSNPETGREALLSALAALHRAGEVLRALSLDGVMVFCGELELLLQELSSGVLSPSPTYGDTLQRAISALMHYLDALADGAGNSPLCLFPEYQELQQARGMEMAFEVDLFFPDLQAELPASVLAQPVEDVPQARINEECGKYQSALLKWLRQDSPEEALQTMRNAVQATMAGMPPDRRAFWWVASALLDCMVYHNLSPEQSARKLLSHIGLQMKLLAEGQHADAYDSLREMLYVIANSYTVSRTVAGVKRAYALERHLPQAVALPAGKTSQALASMRAQLEATKESWEWCVHKESVTPEFTGQVEQLASLAGQLDRNTLQYLCRQIQTSALQAQDAEQIQRIALDMAMALLLLDSGMEHYRRLDGKFHEQACILNQRLQAGIAGMAQDEGSLADLVMLHCQGEEHGLRKVLLGEIQGNLLHAAQDLDNFDESKQPPFRQLAELLHQAHGGLRFLDRDRAGQLLYALWQILENYAATGSRVTGEVHTVAAALNTLQAYVQSLLNEQEPDAVLLETALQSVQALQQSVIVRAPGVQGAAAQTVAAHKQWEGDELLEVFLEEAQEVLGSMRANLEAIQLHPESSEPLVIIRRGFHTLKGSGRMVGLTDLAEVAWAVERAMNKWLQGSKPITPGLLKFILDSETAFKGWVDSLRAHGSTQVEAGELVSAAQQIEAGRETTPTAQPEGPVATIVPSGVITCKPPEAPVAVPAEVPAAIVAPKAEPELPPSMALSPAQLAAALGDMSLAVRNRQEPQACPELVGQLHADRKGAAKQAEAFQ